MPRATAQTPPGGARCHCGRVLGHSGRHVGSPAKRNPDAPPRRAKFATAVESQIKDCHARIAALKAQARAAEAQLRQAEEELKPLVALHDVYRNRALPAPEAPAPQPEAPPSGGKPFRIGEGTPLARREAR